MPGTLSDEGLASSLAAIAAAGLDPGWPAPADRRRLADSTGWSGTHLAEAVRRAFLPFSPAACRRLVALGRPAPGTPGSGPVPPAFPGGRRLLAILAGRVPAVASAALFQGLAARHSVVLKPSSAEPVFARLLCDLAARAAPALAGAARLLDAPPGDPRLVALVSGADAVLAYGSDTTIQAVRAARIGRPTLVGGHRESVVVCFADAFDPPGAARRIARAIARDTALYDQSGCLSPQAVLLEEGGAVRAPDFARLLHDALVSIAGRLSPGPVPLLSAAALRMFVEESRLLAASGGLVLPAHGRVPPAVILAPSAPMRPAPGFRVLQVIPFAGEPDLAALLPHLAGRLQGLAVAGDRRRLDAVLARHPAHRPCRTCAPGRLQSPPAAWPENGAVVVRALSAGRGA